MVGCLMGANADDHRPAIEAAGHVPLSFEQATTGNTRWTARGNGYRLAVGAGDVEVGLNSEQLRIIFVGADATAASTGLDALPGKVNYFVGRDPKAWLRDIPTYGRVRYKAVYPGVDMLWYGNQGRLEYDLDLQPGADPNKIAMRFDGARKLSVEPNGDLRVEMAGGSLSLKLPEVYQEGSTGRTRVAAGYELRTGNEVGFHLSAYDKTRSLIIDPTLVYATYFGSFGPSGFSAPAITVKAPLVDASGNVYIAGSVSYGGAIPTTNAIQTGILGQSETFITKFDPTGKTLLYSTYLGGSRDDTLNAIAVDAGGNLVGVGRTRSADFPLVNATSSTLSFNGNGFAFRLTAGGDQLVYSTYIGGSDSAYAVAFDPSGNAYVAGSGSGFTPTSGALSNCCAFVEKLSPTGSEVYGALIGSQAGPFVTAIAVDALGAAYVAGRSYATSFPTNPPGAHTTSAGDGDAIVAKLRPDATSLEWATFLGGTGFDVATAIALGAGNVVYVGGYTSSPDLPVTAGTVQGSYGGGGDSFVAELSADGSAFGWVTYLGGSKDDILASLAVGSGGLIVAGGTASRDFPVTNAIQPAFPGSPSNFFKSTNSGASFTPADVGLSSSYHSVVLPDPSHAGTIVIDSTQGVYRSTDDGASWTNVLPSSFGGTARSLSNPAVIYSADYCALNKSTDGGQTWSDTSPLCGGNTYRLAIGPTDPNIVLLFYGETIELRSTDGGATFPPTITTPFNSSSDLFQVVASPDGSLYADTGYWGLYKSTDSGLTWIQVGSSILPSYLPGFALSPSSPSILYASDGNNVYKSTNAGTSWTTVGAERVCSSLLPTHPMHRLFTEVPPSMTVSSSQRTAEQPGLPPDLWIRRLSGACL